MAMPRPKLDFLIESNVTREVPSEESSGYKFEKVLGHGQYSQVWRGIAPSGHLVAIKVTDKRKLRPEAVDKLHREVDIHLQCDHPNIVRVMDHFQTSTHFYLIEELMSGGELFDRIQAKTSFAEREASALMRKIVMAVSYLHDRGIAHRDLKPENILFADSSEEADVKIADFGLAKLIDDGLVTPCGTPGYLAPEVAKLEAYKKGVDMWALGVILFILLSGYPPFYHKDTRKLLQIIRKGEYVFHSPIWDNISESAKDLVRNMLTVDQAHRYSAAQALQHPWLQGTTAPAGAELLTPRFLQSYGEKTQAVQKAIDEHRETEEREEVPISLYFTDDRPFPQLGRLLLVCASRAFRDVRLASLDQVLEREAAMPLGMLPALEGEGLSVGHPEVIVRVLARLMKLDGTTDAERASVEAVLAFVGEIRREYIGSNDWRALYSPRAVRDAGRAAFLARRLPEACSRLEAHLVAAGGRAFVGDTPSVADLAVYELLSWWDDQEAVAAAIAHCPHLVQFRSELGASAAVTHWVTAVRPRTY